ncbi:anti-sigma factor RsbA family regulatory protein [Couchioplanes caeruleus]|uniref:Transcriptional regulator n=2 Tax=Couchioplanes caeruleus TaxID=56438 RepID=A0A1K0FEQ5_9ACTN|nr:anti-sigma factor RsbA family regulatory protein [Couchioplanes caeruleus]OJF11216.1 transcriptional regulator [Couchioplanes caeruleus subsp. caeruleus]OJF15980.1 transcriptional regulator [Couchioplanes caeruleus subsp. caeruleus]ROP27835.1 anti-sigma regulatory factor (Ser/Thr protein kinase) [Couchioplanes caeruleus]
MRTGAAAEHLGYFHAAVQYASDEELLAVTMPFLLGGLAAGEPTIVTFGERTAELVRAALPAGAPVEFLSGGAMYARPAAAIRSYRALLARHVEAGAAQIRIIGEIPAAAFGNTWDWWARYESAINHAYDDFPLWSMCAYDVRVTPTAVLADVGRTHPRFAVAGGRHEDSGTYIDPRAYLSEHRPPVPDPLQEGPPTVTLAAPTPGQARAAVRAADRGGVPAADVDDLVVAVSETVTNALRYGRAPVRLRVWGGADRIVVTVTDAGPGPKDPFAGLLPATDTATGGRGLWIAHQTCDHVASARDDEGWTIRLIAGGTTA